MFRKGELVIYGNDGICRIEEIGIPVGTPMEHSGKEYYMLTPVFGSGMIYAPLDTKVFMRPILTKEEAEQMIRQMPEIQEESVIGRDVRTLNEMYKGFLATHQCEDLVRLIKTLYVKEKTMEGNGKKLAKTEQEFSKVAKELLHREFAIALDIPYEEVSVYITKKIEESR